MAKAHRDDDNHMAQGHGIDGSRHNTFSRKHMDRDHVNALYQQPAEPRNSRAEIDATYEGDADQKISGSHILAGAREGNKPLIGRGNSQSAHQTGIRDGVKPYIRPTVRRDTGW